MEGTTHSSLMEVNTRSTERGEGMRAFPGSETMACATKGVSGNAGGPGSLEAKRRQSGETEQVCQTTAQREEGKRVQGVGLANSTKEGG
jgi:hypothetical protein